MDSETTIPTITEPTINMLVPEGKVYRDKAIYRATFFGGPLVAGYMMASNFKLFGEPERAKRAWIASILFSILLFGVLFLLPDNFQGKTPNYIIPLFYSLITYYIAQYYQGKKISAHLNAGGSKYGWKRTIPVTLIGMGVLLVPILYVVLIASPAVKYDSVKLYAIDTAKNQIHYNSYNISVDEIDRVAAAAMETGYFSNRKSVALCVKKDNAVYEITVPCNDAIKNNPSLMPAFIQWQKQLKDMLPDHKIVLLIIVDDDFDHVYKRIE